MNMGELIQQLEEIVLRLHVNERRVSEEHDNFTQIIKKIEKPGISILTPKNKQQLSEWAEKRFYDGKLAAYMYVLTNLNHPEVPFVIERLRGMVMVGNKIYTTK